MSGWQVAADVAASVVAVGAAWWAQVRAREARSAAVRAQLQAGHAELDARSARLTAAEASRMLAAEHLTRLRSATIPPGLLYDEDGAPRIVVESEVSWRDRQVDLTATRASERRLSDAQVRAASEAMDPGTGE